MKIMYMEWPSYGREDVKQAFRQEGHCVVEFRFPIDTKFDVGVAELEGDFASALGREAPDMVFSVNYFPVISELCSRHGIRYISWIYDGPYRWLFHRSAYNSCNKIYVFDPQLYLECRRMGMSTVHYLPLAADTWRLDQTIGDPAEISYEYDVSFVGSLYLEKCRRFMEMEEALPDYARGYLEGLVASQMKIEGYNFIQELLGPVIGDLCKAYPVYYEPGGIESREYVYAQYIINEWVTAMERVDLLETIARDHKVDIFTKYLDISVEGVRLHGPVDYTRQMPLVFRQSRINLNFTRRGIHSGIPLRAMDILGSGGFLLSNFQADFLEHFVPGEDFVFYESKEDLVQKVDYYLDHEAERQAIARSGHDKVAAAHTYRHRVREMLDAL